MKNRQTLMKLGTVHQQYEYGMREDFLQEVVFGRGCYLRGELCPGGVISGYRGHFYRASAYLRAILLIANTSVRLSVRYVPVSDENGSTYRHSFSTIR